MLSALLLLEGVSFLENGTAYSRKATIRSRQRESAIQPHHPVLDKRPACRFINLFTPLDWANSLLNCLSQFRLIPESPDFQVYSISIIIQNIKIFVGGGVGSQPGILQRVVHLPVLIYSSTLHNCTSIQPFPPLWLTYLCSHPPLTAFFFSPFKPLLNHYFHLLLRDVMVQLNLLCWEMFIPCRNTREWCSSFCALELCHLRGQV